MILNLYVKYLRSFFILFYLIIISLFFSCSIVWSQENIENILVGVLTDFPPQYSIDKKTGEPVGFAIDIINEVAERSGLTVRYKVFNTWPEMNKALKERQIDLIPNCGITSERQSYFDFTIPVETFHISLFIRKSTTNIHGVSDLTGRTVAVVKTNKGLFIMKKREGIKLQIHDSLEQALLSLLSGNADAFVYPEPPVKKIIRRSGVENHIKIVGKPLMEIKRGIAIQKGFISLQKKLNDVIRNFVETPEYEKIYMKWYGKPTPFWNITRVIIAMGILLALTVLYLMGWRYLSISRLNKALKNSDKKHRKHLETIDSMGMGIFIVDRDYHIRHMNKTMIKWFGDQTGLNCHHSIAGLDTPCPYCQLESVIDLGKMANYSPTTPNGRSFDIACSPVRNSDGSISKMEIIRDITDHKQAENALRESEEKYRSMMESMKDDVYISSSEFKIEYMNSTMIDRVGEDATGKFCHKAIYGLDEKCSWCVFDQIVQKKHVDFEIINPQNDHCYSVMNSPVVHSDGNISKLTIFHDITEIKNIENQLQQAQKMESVGRLAGGVAHDYNNALSVIMGTAELAIDDVDPTGQLHEDLDEILMAGKRAADITRQLLAFARKQTISPKVLDLNNNVENMLKMLRRLIGEDIDLAWLPGVDPWPVKMDPTQIDQILANLCVNARDAIEGVGKVTIESGNITFNEEYCTDHIGFVPGDFVHLIVSDNGCGMDKEILNNIFEPFFTTKDVDKGTGLGLATVYGIVKQNKGFINVYSELDKGTTIKVYLPRHETEAVEIHEETTEEIPTSKGEAILVVEVDSAILKIMQKVLEGLGYTVLTSGAPEKTMDIIKEYTGKIHLLITDVIMPKMNGRDLVEQLQLICPDLKYIFMSGYTADAIANQGVLDKEVNFIQKPFSRRDLAEIVRKVLDEN